MYRSGAKLIAGAWANLLLGDKFIEGGTRKQIHELTYVRTSCTCLVCVIRFHRAQNNDAPSEEDNGSLSSSSSSYTPQNSAMANFVRPYSLPLAKELTKVGGLSSWRELEIGTIIRLNSRSAAKLKFTEDMRQLFSHLCYTGPMSNESVYRKVTTIGVNYYLYNKGKKERKVYLQGDLVQLSIEMGVVKLGTRPLRMDEVGTYYILYKRQVMKIYIGELVLEGNSFGSYVAPLQSFQIKPFLTREPGICRTQNTYLTYRYLVKLTLCLCIMFRFIPTGIKFFVGVGEEGESFTALIPSAGVWSAVVYPCTKLTKPSPVTVLFAFQVDVLLCSRIIVWVTKEDLA